MSISAVADGLAIAVGIDTARYGHHVTFLDQDRKPAAKPLIVTENKAGYTKLRQRLEQLEQSFPGVLFRVRIDAAGQYATNLERFLRRLPLRTVVSIGEPKRNKDYHAAMSPKRASDKTESYAMARYAIAEAPEGTPEVPDEYFLLREIVSRLESQTKDLTRAVNRLHNLLARVFPELPTIVGELRNMWLLTLLEKYPTPQRIVSARSLHKIPYLKPEMAEQIRLAAAWSVGSLAGDVAETLMREVIGQVRQCLEGKKRLEKLLQESYRELPASGHVQVETIPGIGLKTAAVLVAKIIDIRRFETAENLVGYFGVFPEEASSGVAPDGTPLPNGGQRMSTKGSDIVRSYLWNAAKTAIIHNPAIREFYARLRAKGKRGDVALGHCMRKLLHQVFGVWVSNQPFDEQLAQPRWKPAKDAAEQASTPADEEEKEVAGHKQVDLQSKVVTATNDSVPQPTINCEAKPGSVDYAYLREQISMEQVLEHLGYAQRLRGSGAERHGPCPFHISSRQNGKSFCVNVAKQAFHCTNPKCDVGGNALDLWRLTKDLSLYQAAIDLAQTFHLQLRREQRRGSP